MGVIYKAINKINGKAYIGFDSRWPRRMYDHHWKSETNAPSITKIQYFHNAIKKYGFENFDWIILKEDANYEDEMNFIQEHKTYFEYGQGYNLTHGGEGKLGHITTEETKEKLRVAHTGKKPTEKQLEVLRENARKMRGVKRPPDVCKKIGNAHRGRKLSEEHLEKIRKANNERDKSFYQTPEYREKMRQSLSGKKRTPEQIENIRQGALNRKKKEK